MNASRTLLVLLIVAVAGGTWFLGMRGEGDDLEALGLETGESSERTDSSTGLTAGQETLAPVNVESQRVEGREVADALRGSVATRELQVWVRLPEEAPIDLELAVVAYADGASEREGEGESVEAKVATDAVELTRGTLEANGGARLTLPADQSVALDLDGRFCFLGAPQRVDSTVETVHLDARAGACLTVRVVGEDVAAGKLTLFGVDFSGRSGWEGETREESLTPREDLVFRALDTTLTWAVTPEVPERYTRPKSGVQLAVGEERILEFAATDGGTIEGEVRDSRGKAVAGAEVRIAANPMNWMGGSQDRKTTTDSQGRFTLHAVAPGDQKVEAVLEGFRTAESEDFKLEDGEVVSGMRLVLDTGESIQGSVSWADGAPAVGADVFVEARQANPWGNWGGPAVRRAGSVRTASDGSFVVPGLAPGAYTVRASMAKSGSSKASLPLWRDAETGVKSGTANLQLQLEGPLVFRGRVLDDLGEAVTAFTIEVNDPEEGGATERDEFEDDEGRFEFARVGPGEWEVAASAPGHVQLKPATLLLGNEGADLVLTLQRTATVTGRVVSSMGQGVLGATIQGDDGSSDGNPWAGPQGPRVESGEDGRFELSELTPGALILTASSLGFADSETTTLQLTAGSTVEDVTLTLRVGGRIKGQVLTSEGDGVPAQRVMWGSNAMGFGSRGETTTNARGEFVFEHVTPGDWAVSATPSMEQMADQMQGRRDNSAFTEIMGQMITETVAVVDGETVEVFLGGEPRRPVLIVGRVTLAGEPVAGASIFAVSESSAVFQGMKSVQSNADGLFEIEVDRPGPHTVSAQKGDLGVAIATVIPELDRVKVDLPIPLGRIAGKITKGGGKPAVGVNLSIQREDGLGRIRWGGDQAVTDELGEYSIEALEEGRYTIRANTATWGGRSDPAWGTAIEDGIAVSKDENVTGIDFELEKAGSVSGVVVGPEGQPIAKASLFFRDGSGRVIAAVSATTTSATGEFRKDGLSPGEYTISARATGYASNDSIRVRVTSGAASEVRVGLEASGYVIAILEEEAAQLQARFEVVNEEGVDVGGLWTLEDIQAFFNEGSEPGEQRLGPFPPGKYVVRATLADGRQVEKSVTLRGRSADKKVRLKF